MKEATFDPARELTLYFRCNRAGSKNFVFTHSDGTAYSFIYDELELNIYKNQGDKKKLISLNHVFGIALSSNTVTASITKALSNIPEGEYYWELYRTDLEETWLTGDAIFHNGKFDGVTTDSESITVIENGEAINITVTNLSSAPGTYETIIKVQNSTTTTASVSGTDTYTATLAPAITAYVEGQTFKLTDVIANTVTNPTINFNGLGAKNLVNYKNQALSVGDFVGSVIVMYDGTAFRMVGGSGGGGTAATTTFTPAGGIAATNVQAAIEELDTEKAPLSSPALTGNPTAPTQSTSDNSTKIATTAFVQAAISAGVNAGSKLYMYNNFT